MTEQRAGNRGNRLEYIIGEGEQIHTVRMLLKLKLGCSTRLLRKLREPGSGVWLNDRPVRMNQKGCPGDRLTIRWPKEQSLFEPEAIPLDILYEDEALLALNKQPGLVVHPTKGHSRHTIANGLMQHYLESGQTGKIRFINRLDRDTSGVLLVGKNAYCQEDFARQAAAGTVRKQYWAVTQGVPEPAAGIIDQPIGQPDPDTVVRQVTPSGYASQTAYRVQERFPGDYALVEIELLTGRTHQIRVHLAYLGCPVVGDSLYGHLAQGLIERQALHAAKLELDHPVSRQRLILSAPWPDDFEGLLAKLRQTGDSLGR